MQPPPECRWNFPPVDEWPVDDDVVATGADLQPDTLLWAYAHGIFPMHLRGPDSPIAWWSPVERGVIPLDGLRITRSMRQSARKYRCTIDAAFERVMIECATNRTDGNWITEDFLDAYGKLHVLGAAHSVEVWDGEKLVGGLYGVRINRFFAGESMFHHARDASKVALMHLVGSMVAAGMTLLDTQWCTPHLESLGCEVWERADYLDALGAAVV
ncbi:MAG: leucyl/phenylalanyl-tRNA--protein transferase [Actinomycetota bacterium]